MLKKSAQYLDALRLNRWPRSLAILPGYIAAIVLSGDSARPGLASMGLLLLAFLLTWLISTANYIINEITDAPFDAHHPTKKHRPLVQKQINSRILMVVWLGLIVLCALISLALYNRPFQISLGALLIAGILYNVPPIRLKDIPFLDSTAESANNPIRFLIGWYVASVSAAPVWLLIAWWLFGNFLMIGKRVAEKKFLSQAESQGYRKSLTRIGVPALVAFMVFNGLGFLAAFSLFLHQSGLSIMLWSLPLVLVYLAMFFRKSLQDPDGAEEPERLLKNPVFAFYTLFLIIFFIVAYLLRGA
jgi:4-hydroxybenzoate polyprenyltransferase